MKKVFGLVALAAAALGLLLLAVSARADSFGVTNSLAGAVTLVGYPTNSANIAGNTNNTGFLTGAPVSVQNNEYAGFEFTGLPAAGSNGTITVTLVTAQTAGTPLVSLSNTTNGYISRLDWESTAPITLIFGTPVGGWPVTSNMFTWHTNLDRAWIGPANWIGVYSITNATTNSYVLTNVVISLNKKIIPIRYP